MNFQNHHHFLDSMIVLDMMKKDSYGFNTFAGLRVGEIQQKTPLNDWHHIPSKENISDILTRGATPDKLGPGTTWQCGPSWLSGPPSQWPDTQVAQNRLVDKDMEIQVSKFLKKSQVSTAKVAVQSDKVGLDKLISYCGNLPKLVRFVAYLTRYSAHLVRWAGRASIVTKEEKNLNISASEYEDAYICLIKWEQKQRLNEKNIAKLVPRIASVKLQNISRSIDLVVLGGRVKNFPIGFSSNSDIPIIPYGDLARLIVLYHHQKHHRDVDTTVAMVRREVWPIKARKLAAEIDSRCNICKVKRMHYASQKMGDLPPYRSQMLPSFSVVLMDLFGPMSIRDDVVKKGARIYKKVWGVVFTCASTRAVHLDVATDYSTEAVIHTVRRLMAVRGDVRMIISDPGTQLVGASNELRVWRQGWDQGQLVRFGAEKSLDWKFVMANSQHQNGATEIMVKLIKGLKKSMLSVLGDTKLCLNEMFTLLAEVGNLINERPIGIKPNEKSSTDYLSPNSLLLGRCSSRISGSPFEPFDD